MNVPAVRIERPISVATSAQVKDSFGPNQPFASEITRVATVASGETEIQLVRYDWPDSDPVMGVGRAADQIGGHERAGGSIAVTTGPDGSVAEAH